MSQTQINTPVMVLQQLVSQIEANFAGIKPIFTPELNHARSVQLLTAKNNLEKVLTDNTQVPLFLFNRSPLRFSDNIGRRPYFPVDVPNSGQVNCFRAINTSFDFRWAFSTPNFSTMESFELEMLNRQGIGGISQIDVDLSNLGLGILEHKISWGQLEDFELETDNYYHKLLTGSAVVNGVYLSFTGEGKIIEQINLDINDWLGANMDQCVIT